jgi:hypothetical protein
LKSLKFPKLKNNQTITDSEELKIDKISYILGIALLLIGIAAYLFSDNAAWLQSIGLILIAIGIVFMVLGLFYSSKRKQSVSSPQPPSTASSQKPLTPQSPVTTQLTPPQPVPTPPVPQSTIEKEPAKRLEDLKKLLDHYLITEEDYEKKRKEILSQI